MADSPAWLSEDSRGAAPAAPDPIIAAAPVAAPPLTSSNNAAFDADDKELPGIILIMRLANMGASVALMACSVSVIIFGYCCCYCCCCCFLIDTRRSCDDRFNVSKLQITNTTYCTCQNILDSPHDILSFAVQLGLGCLRHMRWSLDLLP
jgi:hypothetical protein